VLLLAALMVVPAFADIGFRDPEFSKYPFEKWLSDSRQAQIHWSVVVAPAELSTHQRMILRVMARVDGRELEKRRSAGGFVGLIEYTDSAGHVWQNHASIDTARLHTAMQQQYLEINFYAFVLPGDYSVSLGVCDPKTMEHSVAVRKLHVSGLKTDPLPDSWAGLPPVDIVPGSRETPDVWYLPEVGTQLNLPVETKRPVHVQVLLNATPTQRAAGSMAAMRENMSVLVPALKILTQMRLKNGTIDVAMIDLTHRKVPFAQSQVAGLDWSLLRRYFLDTKPGIIDIHTLEAQTRMLGFFEDEVRQRLTPPKDGATPVVIVLSGPAFFEDQDPVTPPPDAANAGRLFYIRYRTIPMRRNPPTRMPPGRFGGRYPVGSLALADSGALIPPMKEDDLQKTAEPLNARLFDAASALQFRRILAAVIEQISRM
jgi:hypothetical protein